MIRARSFALLALLGGWSSEATAGPWVKAPGEAYLKVSGSSFSSDQVVDATGSDAVTPWVYDNQTVSTYLELGLAPRLGLNLNLPYQTASNTYSNLVFKQAGLGDLGVGLNFAAIEGRCPVSLSLNGSIPLYDGVIPSDAEIAGTTGGSTPEERYTPMLGDGAYEIQPGVSAGCSLYPIPVWLTASISYGLRTEGFGDGVRSSFGAGGFVWPGRLALVTGVDVVQRFDNRAERPTKSYLSVYGGLLATLGWGLALEASVSHIPGGVFVAKGSTYNLGLSYTGRLFPDPFAP